MLLNIAPDHLDRHASFEDYVAAKLRIFANQSADDIAVVPAPTGSGRARRRLGPGSSATARGPEPSWPI